MIQYNNGAASTPAKASKACMKCRGLKMKCKVDQGPSCRRCLRTNTLCVFKPRANASSRQDQSPLEVSSSQADWPGGSLQSVLSRLDAIEGYLQSEKNQSPASFQEVAPESQSLESPDPSLRKLWHAVTQLKSSTRKPHNTKIWSQFIIRQLWETFHTHMPGLHFLPTKQTFSAPTPLLVASMLFVSALRNDSPELASLAVDYFVVMSNAIAELAIPRPDVDNSQTSRSSSAEEEAYQDVLGIILAAITCEASIKTTGIWISIAYRLILESCPTNIDERSRDWKKLFVGLQVIDLEHASLHMSCPVIPLRAPLYQLHISSEDDIYSLTQMMHTGLTHFTGRGLPTIWSCFSTPSDRPLVTAPFTAVDAAVIRDWASQLDRWLARFNTPSRRFAPEHDRNLVFRQYILHRLLVLSIYHPARGFDLFASSTTSIERQELLVSARAALKMQLDDKTIWSNWDLVMITWAALLVLQGVDGGVGEVDDLLLVQDHLNTLRATQQPQVDFRNRLATQLESSLQNVSTPPAPSSDFVHTGVEDPMSWSIFDEMSINFANPGQWLLPEPHQ